MLGLLVALMAVAPHAQSQSGSTPVTGWMWSDNIGWVSLNCSNTNDCSPTWGLSLSGSAVTGYAWSDNIGWIKFGELGPTFPAGGGSATEAAFSGGNFSGWARACTGTTSGNCTNKIGRTDGWDGWISLSGTSPTYKVDTDANASYLPQTSGAWGSEVVGWLGAKVTATASCVPTTKSCTDSTHYSGYTDASCNEYQPGECAPSSFCQDPGGACVQISVGGCLSIGVNPGPPLDCIDEVSKGRLDGTGKATLYWRSIPSTLDGCTLKNTSGATVDTGLSGDYTTPTLTTGSYTYTLTCTLNGDTVITKQVTVSPLPVYEEI